MASSKTGMAPTESTSTADKLADAAHAASDKLSETAATVKQKVSDTGRRATGQIDAKREPAADALEDAASSIHEKAENLPGGDTVKGIAHSTADKLETTADYIRGHDVKSMLSDVEDIVRRNPGPSLLAAVAVGFLIGRAFRED